MAIYPYICDETGERREVHASMRNVPPEIFADAAGVWRREYGEGIPAAHVRRYGVTHGVGRGLPVSVSLPTRDIADGTPRVVGGRTVYEYQDAGRTDDQGRWIIDTKQDRDTAQKVTGFRED